MNKILLILILCPLQGKAQLFPNDAGPTEIDISNYPKEMQSSYLIFKNKCSACHTIARPINSQFLELSSDELKKAKIEQPDIFKDSKIIEADESIWNRYVKRMMSKPGCPVLQNGKRIWEFLVYDSKIRKTGSNLREWISHRKKLVQDFKNNNPEQYIKIFGKQD